MKDATFILLGATGDLTKRKLIPAIYYLLKNKKIKKFSMIGAAITKTTIDKILKDSEKFIPKINRTVWKDLKKNSHYFKLDFYKKDDFTELKKYIYEVEKKRRLSGNRIFYLATMPEHFTAITKHLASEKLTKQNSRVVYEKPFGDDLKSAKAINKKITKLFDESRIYRIDHYLWDELISNIVLIRFTNIFFQPIWNKKYVESVKIFLNESIDVGKRFLFYERYGAIKDVVQNHMLQMLALVAMEEPKRLVGDCIRKEKAKVLKKTKPTDVVLGKYSGYKGKAETFAALKLFVNNRRWRGVPFFLQTGKGMSAKDTRIEINFKKTGCLKDQCPFVGNKLSIKIYPREGLFLGINTKKIGPTYEVVPSKMDFCHPCQFGPNSPKAYEVLLEDVFVGDQTSFVSFNEIKYSWKFIERIKKPKIYTYKKGSDGPKKAKEIMG
jgi:glucose-6-phosphate 1-dehydrogenase